MDEQKERDGAEGDNEPLKDLDVDQDEADKVMGGRSKIEDPCAGGE